MLFWLTVAAVAAGGFAWLGRAAFRPLPEAAANPDLAVYRAQLDELGRDEARGVIAAADARAIRADVARRILDSDRAARGRGLAGDGGARLPVIASLLAIGGAFGLYLMLGAPDYPDLPHSARVQRSAEIKAARPSQAEAEVAAMARRPAPPPPAADFAALMDKLRAAVAARPGDIEGLTLLARNERTLGNLSAAARAEEKLVAALGDKASANDQAALADILVNAAGGTVTAEAEAAIAAALAEDPANGTARFYAGLLEAQIGRPDLAFRMWNALLADSPAEAPWVGFLRAELPMLAEAAGTEFRDPAPKGPGAADMAAAAGMSASDRAGMIKGMVGGLEERLMAQGGTAAEWAQLVKALGVLDEKDRARAALARAETALAADPAGLAGVRAAAQEAGIAP